MPKGVEHKYLWYRHRYAWNVLNLWCRKALSTVLPINTWLSLLSCWISDAERRWAHSWIWQKHHKPTACWISDAERRWAQIINDEDLIEFSVLNLWCRKALSTQVWRVSPKKIVCVLNLWCRKALSTFTGVFRSHFSASCWISDAERRWAPIQYGIMRPDDAECWISDAERRWAHRE